MGGFTQARNIALGKGWHNTGTTVATTAYPAGSDTVNAEGLVQEGENVGAAAIVGMGRDVRSPERVTRRLVRNAATIALRPKRLVSYASGSEFKRVDGYTTTSACPVAGVVDEHWPTAGVPVGELFWIVIKGPALCLTDLANQSADYSTNAPLVALTAATSQATTAGRVAVMAVTTNVTYAVSHCLNKVGVARTEKLTNSTNADILVEVDLY